MRGAIAAPPVGLQLRYTAAILRACAISSDLAIEVINDRLRHVECHVDLLETEIVEMRLVVEASMNSRNDERSVRDVERPKERAAGEFTPAVLRNVFQTVAAGAWPDGLCRGYSLKQRQRQQEFIQYSGAKQLFPLIAESSAGEG